MDKAGGRSDEPVAVLEAALQQLAQRAQPQHSKTVPVAAPQAPLFIPASRFKGVKQGYYFGTGEDGTG